MVLPHMILEIGELWKGALTLFTRIGLLARVRSAHMDVKPILLWKEIPTLSALVLRKVGVPMIDDQTLLSSLNTLRATRHAAAPHGAILSKRERVCGTTGGIHYAHGCLVVCSLT
jgi:hypothetical protein